MYGCHAAGPQVTSANVKALLAQEEQNGLSRAATYAAFQTRVEEIKDSLLAFLIAEKREGRAIAGYGAAAKGNTLLNFAGVRPDLLPYVCDAAASKQGRWMPGSRIPIVPPQELESRSPDTILVLPWNIASEVARQLVPLARRGAQLVTAIPRLRRIPWLG